MALNTGKDYRVGSVKDRVVKPTNKDYKKAYGLCKSCKNCGVIIKHGWDLNECEKCGGFMCNHCGYVDEDNWDYTCNECKGLFAFNISISAKGKLCYAKQDSITMALGDLNYTIYNVSIQPLGLDKDGFNELQITIDKNDVRHKAFIDGFRDLMDKEGRECKTQTT